MNSKAQVTKIGLAGGLNVKVDPKELSPPSLTTADNIVYQTAGLVRKRSGLTAMVPTILSGAGLTVGAGLVVQSVNGELCYTDGTAFYSWSPTYGAWINRGQDYPPLVTSTPVTNSPAKNTYGQQFGNVVFADIGNIRCVAYDSAYVLYSNASPVPFANPGHYLNVGFFDLSNNTWLFTPTPMGGSGTGSVAMGPAVAAIGSYFHVYYVGNSFHTLFYPKYRALVFNTGSLSVGYNTPANQDIFDTFVNGGLIPGWSNALGIDASSNGSAVYVTFCAGVYTTGSIPSTGAQGAGQVFLYVSTTAPTPAVTPPGNSAFGIDPNLLGRTGIVVNSSVALLTNTYSLTTECVYLPAANWSPWPGGTYSNFGFDPTYASALFGGLGPTVTATTQTIVAATFAGAGTSVQDPGYAIGTVAITNGGSTVTLTFNAVTTYPWPNQPCGNYPVAKPFWSTTDGAFEVWTQTLGQESQVLQPTLSLQDLSHQKVVARASYDTAAVTQSGIPNSAYAAVPTVSKEILYGSANTLARISIPTTAIKTIIPLDVGAFVTGARPTYYDSQKVIPLGFDAYPELPPTIVATSAGGNLTASTQYFYCAIYRYFDSTGKLMLSAPSEVLTCTSASSGTGANIIIAGTITAGMPQFTGATGTIQAVLYRTTAADTINFRELGLLPFPVPTTTPIQYVDTISDATLSANGLSFLYAPPVGGELPNDPPVACTLAAATQQRVFIVSSENPTRLYFSKPFDPVRVLEFNADSFQNIDPASGPINGIAVLDSNVLLFKRAGIYVLSGNGPDATGAGAFNLVTKIATDDGCISGSSVLASAAGVFYQSTRGIQLLDRSLTTRFVGAPIESLTQGQTVTAAVLLSTPSQVRFFLSNGTSLVYDYLLEKWSTFSSPSGYYATSSCVWNSQQVTLDTVNKKINLETAGSFTDNGATYAMTLETPWIQFAGQQTWNRLRRVAVLGDYKSANTANLSFAYDWQTSYLDTVAFTTSVGLTGGDTVYQWRARSPRQVMQAVRLKLIDSSTAGESYDISSFELEWYNRGGVARLPGQKSV